MNRRSAVRGVFLTSIFLGAAAFASAGFAQGKEGSSLLEEVTVTATRTVDTANRVPLSIAAVTQESMDQQGIKTAADLVRFVPSLNAVANPGGGQQTFSIRGIVGTTGAATTSVYLDDTNLTKRANGGVAQNNGVVAPVLYDLERVEVLKGPQGTLYGGSSEGGTVRYITPTPSLTKYSGSTRAEVSTMGARGELSNELGFAVGGPVVQDKLGFRVSGIRQTYGGWVDSYSAYTNKLLREDANSTKDWAVRATLLWQFADHGSAQLSAYHVDNWAEGGVSTTTALYLPNQALAPAGTTFSTQARCITNNQRTAAFAQPGGPAATTFIPTSTIGACATTGANTPYTRASSTYGPFVTGKDISVATGRQATLPATSKSDVASMTVNYDLDFMTVRSITSFLQDQGNSNTTGGEEWNSTTGAAGQTTSADPAHKGFPLFQAIYNSLGEGYTGSFLANNNRHSIEQELRFSSVGEGRFSWVGGGYFSNSGTHILYRYMTDPTIGNLPMQLMYGPGMAGPAGNTSASAARYGVVEDQGFQARLEATIQETEYAAFGEGNFWIVPDKLRVTAGLRYSKVKLDYYQTNFGQFSGRLDSSQGTVTAGKSSDTPLTPKVGLQYQFNENNMVYTSASKGFRAGGVNSQISQTICQTFLDQLGITAAEVPTAFGPDTVWSYELGGKFRVLDNLQVNLAVFQINWNDIQATTTLGCGQGFTANGGKARSRGGEIQVQYRPLRALNLYLNAGYTDAYYVDAVTGPVGAAATAAPQPSFNAGDKFDIPPLQVSTGGQFDFAMGNIRSYVRLDYTYQNRYNSGASLGSSGWGGNFFLHDHPSIDQVNMRLGMRFDNGVDVNLFAVNLLDRDKQIVQGLSGFNDGRGACSSSVATPAATALSATCGSYVSYTPFVNQAFQTPRRYGLQANYKF